MYPETDYRLGRRSVGNGTQGHQYQRSASVNNASQAAADQQAYYARMQKAQAEASERMRRDQEQSFFSSMYGNGLGGQTSYSAPPKPAITGPAHWSVTLGVSTQASVGEIKAAYRRLAVKAHPDHGGSTDAMAKLNAARDQGIRERKAA